MAFGQRFIVLCTGHAEVGDHVEYIFHVSHMPTGGEWNVQWRFSDLFDAHNRLAESLDSLPSFPPKGLPGLGLFSGQEFIIQRARALQHYFEAALAREAVAGSPGFQLLLGMRPPEAARAVRVRRWRRSSAHAASVELDVEAICRDRRRPVEELLATASLASGLPAPLAAATGRSLPDRPLQLDGLPCGEEVTLRVRAQNGVGASEALAVRLRVPGRRRAPVLPGMRVRALWAGDGRVYDALAQHVGSDGTVVVNWLRPAPLSDEQLACVCEAGGDDTQHRYVDRADVVPVGVAVATGDDDDAAFDEAHTAPLQARAERGGEGPPPPQGDVAASPCASDGAAGSPTLAKLLGAASVGALAPDFGDDDDSPGDATPPRRSAPAWRAAVDDAGKEADAEGAALFHLGVQLTDEEAEEYLVWRAGEDVAPAAAAFVARHRLKALFSEPLRREAERMEGAGQRRHVVDVADLLL